MSLTVVILIIFSLWIGALLFYLYVSNQHSVIAEDIREINQLIGDGEGID